MNKSVNPGQHQLPLRKEILCPDGGWEDQTYYIVDVSFNSHNPIFRAIFFTGFLNHDGRPGGYNQVILTPNSNWNHSVSDVYYMRAIRRIMSRAEMHEVQS